MENQYLTQTSRWWLMLIWIISVPVSTRAQTAQSSVIQWQRTLDGGDLTPTSHLRAVKANDGGYVVLAGKNLVRFSMTGDVTWTKPLNGAYQDSISSYVPIRETLALTTTQDGGFLTLGLDALNRYYVTKLNAEGAMVWTKAVNNANVGPSIRISDNAITSTSDGSILVVGTYRDALSYLNLTKINKEGVIVSQWRVNYSSPQPATPIVDKVLNTRDGGYLLVGKALDNATASSQGLAIKLNGQYSLAWKNTYPGVDSLSDVIVNPSNDNAYVAVGLGAGGNGRLISIAPNGGNDGSPIASFTGSNAVASLAKDGDGNLTVLDGIGANNGDLRLLNVTTQSTERWRKTVGGPGRDVPASILATDDGGYLVLGTTTSTNGDVVGKSTSTLATWVVKLGTSPVVTTLRLLAPLYDCQSGTIVFTTTGGDGTPITYTAPGVTRAKATDNVGTLEQGLRNDPKVILIKAAQRGQTVSYAFNFGTYCQNVQATNRSSDTSPLRMSPPTYNCQTGAITFYTTGGAGSSAAPIEYMAAGITGWTTNPSQFVDPVLRTATDAQPITLVARQGEQMATYVLDIKAACGRARMASTEPLARPTISVLGNPVRESFLVEITGAQDKPLSMQLLDARGRLIEQRSVEQPRAAERQTFDVRQQASGVLLLQTTINGELRTVKVIKQ
ncbi:hypothetical protein GCM10027341_05010 [Spirosoma knui]